MTLLDSADYSLAKWAEIEVEQAAAIAAINAATVISGVEPAKEDGLVKIAAVPTLVEELAAAKEAAVEEIEAAFDSLKEKDYSPENWQEIVKAKDDALAEILTEQAQLKKSEIKRKVD